MSLYRTYRPKTFADVVGQDHIVTTLETAVSQDKLTHAYLFAGQRGTGKTSVARILAKAILAKGIEDLKFRDQILKGVDEGSIVDLIEIDAASNRGIDDIRDLVEKIQFSPVVASAKVYIIDEVHMLTKEAFNALLKTLEEPPPYTFFILATTELQKIPATIQSRCQRFTFRQINEEDLIRRLQYIADQERIVVDRGALRAMAHHAAGGMRDAISLLDQLRSLDTIQAEDVLQRIGESGQEHVEHLLAAIAARDQAAIIETVRKVEEAGLPIDTLARQILSALRVQLHETIARQEPSGPLVAALDALLHAIKDIRIAPVPALVLESALLTLCQGSSLPAPSAKPPSAQKAVKTEKKVDQPVAEQKEPIVEVERKEEKDESPAPGLIEAPELSLQSILARWSAIVEASKPAALKMSLKNGRVTALEKLTVTLTFSSKFHRDRVANQEASHTIEAVMEEMFKRPLRIQCVVDEDHASELPETPAVDLADAVAEVF